MKISRDQVSTVYEMIRETAGAAPDNPAICESGRRTTYSQLLAQVEGVARTLQREFALEAGQRAGLLLPNSLEYVVGYFAILACGGLVVPLNEQYRREELLHFVDNCDVRLIITGEEHAELCRDVRESAHSELHAVYVEQLGSFGRPPATSPAFSPPRVAPESPMMIQFSSGSTGLPKMIARSHEKLLFELDSLTRTLGATESDRFLGVAPFSHVNGLVRSMLASISSAASLYPLGRFNRQQVAGIIEEEQITLFIAVPFMFSILAGSRFSQTPDFSSLRYCISASAPMPEDLNREFARRFGIHVRQLYGSTETGTISVNLSPDVESSLWSVGKPIPGVEVRIFSEDGSPTPEGEMGEFAVRSPAAITEYVGLEEVNREAFRRGFFMTGDLGTIENGLLRLVGRKKFFINKGGYKINPGDIEKILGEHPAVEEVAVVGIPTRMGDEKVKAVIVPASPCGEEALINFCRGKIADFKIPSVIEFRSELPKSSTGKIRKKLLVD